MKALSGFYYVITEDSYLSCRARGKLRTDSAEPLVGDYVTVSKDTESSGTVLEILTRKNCFIRPAVANIDCIVFVASGAVPVTDPFLIDRFSVIAQEAECNFIVCFNKSDLTSCAELVRVYNDAGIKTVCTSTVDMAGLDVLKEMINGQVSTFTGNSGVGKTSILNCLIPGLDLPVSEVSDKLGRGKHTTRHVELFEINPTTFIADTPGFSSLDIQVVEDISVESLKSDFIEFQDYSDKCRYADCNHTSEPGCAIKKAVSDKHIHQTRYESYVRLYNQVKSIRKWR